MVSTIIVGIIFAGIVIAAFIQSKKDVKESKCAGCSGCTSKMSCPSK